MHTWLFVILISLFTLGLTTTSTCGQHLNYLGLNPPGDIPELLAPGFISLEDEHEFSSAFSADGNEFFYGVDMGGRNEIRYTRLADGGWQTPTVLVQSDMYSYNDPFLSIDEKRLFFISNQSLDGQGEPKDIDIWYIERRGDAWTDPINVGPPINTPKNEYYISFTESGTMYFASNIHTDEDTFYNFDIYASEPDGDGFKDPIRLSDSINTHRYEADAFIAYDESYIIFSTIRNRTGTGDLYISFKKPDGTWTAGASMGDEINTPGHELCPFVTRDGAYFLYTSDKDIYWVRAEQLIGRLRKEHLGNEEG